MIESVLFQKGILIFGKRFDKPWRAIRIYNKFLQPQFFKLFHKIKDNMVMII